MAPPHTVVTHYWSVMYPIEHAWNDPKRCVYLRTPPPKTLQKLRIPVIQEMNKMSQEVSLRKKSFLCHDDIVIDRKQKAQMAELKLGNNSVTVKEHGATVTSWKNNGEEILFCRALGATVISWVNNGEEILFCSKNAVFDDKKAIRGGIPIVFPQFGPWDKRPQHGFARIKAWTLSTPPTKIGDGEMMTSFSLTDDDQTRAMWDAKFKLLYTVTLKNNSLETKLSVTNTGSDSFDFTTLMHTYFRVPDINKARIVGLQGLEYTDKVHGGDHTEDREKVFVDENYDRIYKNCSVPVQLYPEGEGSTKCVTVNHNNLPDIVVWNPWSEKAKAMSDFGDDEWPMMVCVEAGAVAKPVNITAGTSLEFSQNIVVGQNSNKL